MNYKQVVRLSGSRGKTVRWPPLSQVVTCLNEEVHAPRGQPIGTQTPSKGDVIGQSLPSKLRSPGSSQNTSTQQNVLEFLTNDVKELKFIAD